MNGNRHDSHVLRESNLLNFSRDVMPEDGDGVMCLPCGDPACPQSAFLLGGCAHTAPGTAEAAFNADMSKVREAVEWGFEEAIAQFRFLDCRASAQIFKMPIARCHVIAAFSQNIRSTIHDNQTSVHFEMDAMSAEEHLNSVDN